MDNSFEDLGDFLGTTTSETPKVQEQQAETPRPQPSQQYQNEQTATPETQDEEGFFSTSADGFEAEDGEAQDEYFDSPVDENEAEFFDVESEGQQPESRSEQPQWFLEAPDKDIRYRDRDAAIEGITRKNELIREYREQLETLQKQVQDFESQTSQLKQAMPEDLRMELMIQQNLPEEFRGKVEDDFAFSDEFTVDLSDLELDIEDYNTVEEYREARNKVDEQRRERERAALLEYQSRVTEQTKALADFKRARAEAEAKVNSVIQSERELAERRIEEYKEKLDEAQKFVRQTATPDFFEATNVEDRIALNKLFSEQFEYNDPRAGAPQKMTLDKVAFDLYARYGEKVAQTFLEGVRANYFGDRGSAARSSVRQVQTQPRSVRRRSSAQAEPQDLGNRPTAGWESLAEDEGGMRDAGWSVGGRRR